ncbi:MAG: hypothetical protein HYX69_14765 [Planctomycetia bacterium]|nr:hypothetical protein [Planctomycetia bacterium]
MVDFETHIGRRLRRELPDVGDRYFAGYMAARAKLMDDILREIKGVEPSLSDHSADHIENVLSNAAKLLTLRPKTHGLSAIELYCLGMFVLFHDVGNLFGRTDHHKKVSEIYDWTRGTTSDVQHEKTLVLAAAAAHTGLASDGTRDTLKELPVTEHLNGHRVRLQQLAAILRLADELAEGPQRTSDFMQQHALYVADSRIFHQYASVTHVFIDRGNARVCLTYEIDIGCNSDESEDGRDRRIVALLEFVYQRAVKLDQERRYSRFYSPILSPFQTTSITFNFRCNRVPLSFSLPPISLDDKIIPGEPCRSLVDMAPAYSIPRLLADLRAHASKVVTP